jgi:hypothetical protein
MPEYTIRVKAPDLRIVKEHLANGKKIQAIKHARNTGKQYPGAIVKEHNAALNEMVEVKDHRVGLKCAKHAVEVLQGSQSLNSASAVFAPTLKIVSFKIETEDGMCEVDIDTLRLRLLDGMSDMSLHEMGHVTELAAYVANWQNGDLKDMQ